MRVDCRVFPRLLKAMGWQEYPENDDNFLPLTEDELREFQTKTEQVGAQARGRSSLKTLPQTAPLSWR